MPRVFPLSERRIKERGPFHLTVICRRACARPLRHADGRARGRAVTVKNVSRALRRLAARLIRAPAASDDLLLRDAEFQILMMEFRYPPIQYSRVLAVTPCRRRSSRAPWRAQTSLMLALIDTYFSANQKESLSSRIQKCAAAFKTCARVSRHHLSSECAYRPSVQGEPYGTLDAECATAVGTQG